VALAEAEGCELAELPLDKLQAIEPGLTAAVHDVLSVEASVASRASYGGTAPVRVREQARRWREELG
jgi:argininosuccinate lyase